MSLAEKVMQLQNGAPGIPRIELPAIQLLERSAAWRREQRQGHRVSGTGRHGFHLES